MVGNTIKLRALVTGVIEENPDDPGSTHVAVEAQIIGGTFTVVTSDDQERTVNLTDCQVIDAAGSRVLLLTGWYPLPEMRTPHETIPVEDLTLISPSAPELT